jgi:anti-sigma-K factor RskA
MTEHFDPFEAELAALAPHEPSARMQQRIADQLQTQAKHSAWPHFAKRAIATKIARFTIAAGLATCALATFVLRPSDRPGLAKRPAEIMQPQVAVVFDDTLPSVWVYQRALAHSLQELDALFDKHALLASPIGSRTPAPVFIHSKAELLLLGEL